MTEPELVISLVEDETETRNYFAMFIERTPGFSCLGSYGTAEAALRSIPKRSPDVVLVDLHLPLMSGVECVRALRTRLPDQRILVLTKYEDPNLVFAALEAGANGYLLKRISPSELLAAVRRAHNGHAAVSSEVAALMVNYFNERGRNSRQVAELAPRERETLELLAKGYSYKEIAVMMAISFDTVNSYTKTIYTKLHVHSRAQAVAKLRQL